MTKDEIYKQMDCNIKAIVEIAKDFKRIVKESDNLLDALKDRRERISKLDIDK